MQKSAFVEESARVDDWPGLMVVGFAENSMAGGSPIACLLAAASSASALANETEAKATNINKSKHLIKVQPRTAPLAATRFRRRLSTLRRL
ncbi:MAG: hypothetical protein U1E25_15405 [Methylocystis sp.]